MPTITTDKTGQLLLEPRGRDEWKKCFRRPLFNGKPGTGKTSGFMTLPGPRHIVIAPGEHGHSSIQEDEQTKVYHWLADPGDPKVVPAALLAQFKIVVANIATQAYGPVTTLAIDGLHKLFDLIQRSIMISDNKEFGKYHRAFLDIISPLIASTIPYVAASCYDGAEAVEAGSKETTIMPGLPGRMAVDIMGQFPVVFHTSRTGVAPNEKFEWQVKASPKVGGALMHLPKEIRDKFPSVLPQDWNEVEKIIAGVVGE